ncbi:MAG TPA: M20 family metallopeptidase [Chthoniobacteraceae bacterium]|jgi:acetylornithine deacetylase/succinyl-diaminopimelate desuccinylase family protein|nr:M20 family metallopeptidase [Chthoniobacteraceae bacterium]
MGISSLDSAAALLQALIRIPSVNPHGSPGIDKPGEQACAEFVGDFLRECGARVELREVAPGRPNVVGCFPTDAPGKPRVILAPHLDTVSVGGMTIDPFGGELRDGRVWGRGATDTKGPMAAMLWSLRELRERIPSLGHEICFVGLMGEEAGQEGARAFVKEERADFALIGEPTQNEIVYTHKGSFWQKLRTTGRAVHASAPERGENAIYKMADVIRCIREEISPAFARQSHPILGSPTISVGVIRGGTKTNIVPDFCEMDVDIRTIPGQDTQTILAALQKASPGIEIFTTDSSPLNTDPAHPLIQLLLKNGSRLSGAPWFCDAAVFAQAGIPAVAAGPGSIAQAHTNDEWIAVEELERGVRFYRAFIEAL